MPPDTGTRIAVTGALVIAVAVIAGIAGRTAPGIDITGAMGLQTPTPQATRAATPLPAAGVRAETDRQSQRTVALTVTLWPRGPGRGLRTWQIACPPEGPACRTARRNVRVLSQGSVGTSCPGQQGPATEAMVTGRVGTRTIDSWFDYRDACDARAWPMLRRILTPPTARR